VIDGLAAGGARRLLVAPIGFVCDHTEILYDIDVEARRFARDRGVELLRTESLNTSTTFIGALADLVRAHRG
jgi:ferrochelatase